MPATHYNTTPQNQIKLSRAASMPPPATHYNTTPYNQLKLYNAAFNGKEEEVESLVSTRAAHPNTEDSDGRLALCGAALQGQTATVVTLARLGADVNLAESYGDRDTPLTY